MEDTLRLVIGECGTLVRFVLAFVGKTDVLVLRSWNATHRIRGKNPIRYGRIANLIQRGVRLTAETETGLHMHFLAIDGLHDGKTIYDAVADCGVQVRHFLRMVRAQMLADDGSIVGESLRVCIPLPSFQPLFRICAQRD